MGRLRTATPADAARCHQIEVAAYEGDEAASLERIAGRIRHYAEGFLILEAGGQTVGFINSGCAHEVAMADAAFKDLAGHDPEAPNAVILSVAVDPDQQGRGHARALIEAFVARMEGMGKETVHLMCKERHVPFYERFGFRYVQPSQSRHGGMEWHEMVRTL